MELDGQLTKNTENELCNEKDLLNLVSIESSS